MRFLPLVVGVLVSLSLSGPSEALPLPAEPSVCVPAQGGFCATCGFIGFRGGFHFDTLLLCI